MTDFARRLQRCRQAAGYATPGEFYRSAGGRSVLRCTLAQYRNIEFGRCTPKARVMHGLLTVLDLWKEPDKARDLCRAYLASQFKHDELVDFLLRVLAGDPRTPHASRSPLRKALASTIEARTKPLSVEQSSLIRSDAVRYWAFQALASDPGPWTPERLSAALGLSAASVAAALGALVAAGLAERRGDGSFTSPFFNRLAVQSRSADEDARAPSFIPRIRRHWDRIASERGRLLFHQYILIRASESEASAYFPYLAQSLHGLEAYETVEKGPDTAFLVAEATVRRLLPF